MQNLDPVSTEYSKPKIPIKANEYGDDKELML